MAGRPLARTLIRRVPGRLARAVFLVAHLGTVAAHAQTPPCGGGPWTIPADVLARDPALHDAWMRAESLRWQVVMVWPERTSEGATCLRWAGLRADAEAFVPGGAVIPLLAAVALRQARDAGEAWPLDAPVQVERRREEGADGRRVTLSRAWESTLERELHRAATLSVGQAVQRLHDLVGHDLLHASAWQAGLRSVRHLGPPVGLLDETTRRLAPAARVLRRDGAVGVVLPARDGSLPMPPPLFERAAVGSAWLRPVGEGQEPVVMEGPMSLDDAPQISLWDLARLWVALRAPESLDGPGFGLSTEDRHRLLDWLARPPSGAGLDDAVSEAWADDRFRVALPGIQGALADAPGWTWSARTGRIWGFLTEAGVLWWPSESDRWLVLAMTMWDDPDGVVGDDHYAWSVLERQMARQALLLVRWWQGGAPMPDASE